MKRTEHKEWTLEDVLPKIVQCHMSDVQQDHVRRKPQSIKGLAQEVGEAVLLFLVNDLSRITETSMGLRKHNEMLRTVIFETIMKHEEQRIVIAEKRTIAGIRSELDTIFKKIDRLGPTEPYGKVIKTAAIYKAKSVDLKKAIPISTYFDPHKETPKKGTKKRSLSKRK